ncbi:hypothetical protein GCM10022251_35470 [Phytohabitans flavus]|uniref:Uncharacterized protein n=1 Tax=Phytohabitans flavus TaxID=1076124 RepID=A0A6F8XMS6_9ACTN|nr:hypothetical protein [Phytohabitans flavus]BCB75088.1 hypothetical protein Pflav_014980 [Phytohabitans flavus]
MDEKERYDTDREARHDVAADAGRLRKRPTEAMAHFVGTVLYSTHSIDHRTERERKPQPEEDDGPAA